MKAWDIRSYWKLYADRIYCAFLGIVPLQVFPDFPRTNPDNGITEAFDNRGSVKNSQCNGPLFQLGCILLQGAVHYVTQKSAAPA